MLPPVIRRSLLWLCLVCLAGLAPRVSLAADGLAWRVEPEQEFGYRITIKADNNDYVDTLSGTAIYTVESVQEGKIALKCVTSLSSQQTTKGRSRFRRPSIRRRSPLSPFTGLNRTQTNTVTIDPTGEVLTLRGTSQLPYLLGNASLLVLEALPGDAREAWELRESTGISESGGRLPRPRFFSDNDRKTTTGGETTTYRIIARDGNKITIDKTYALATSDAADGKPRFEINGNGKLVFDAERGLPASLEFKQTVTTRKEDTTTSVPLEIGYALLTADEIEQIRMERQKLLAAAQARAAARKQKQKEPLDAKTRKQLLADLESDNIGKMLQALRKLSKRPPSPEDKELKKAIQATLSHKNPAVKRFAADAWANWSAND